MLIAVVAITRHRTLAKARMDAAFRTVRSVADHATRLGAALNRKVSAGEVATIGLGDVWIIGRSASLAEAQT